MAPSLPFVGSDSGIGVLSHEGVELGLVARAERLVVVRLDLYIPALQRGLRCFQRLALGSRSVDFWNGVVPC